MLWIIFQSNNYKIWSHFLCVKYIFPHKNWVCIRKFVWLHLNFEWCSYMDYYWDFFSMHFSWLGMGILRYIMYKYKTSNLYVVICADVICIYICIYILYGVWNIVFVYVWFEWIIQCSYTFKYLYYMCLISVRATVMNLFYSTRRHVILELTFMLVFLHLFNLFDVFVSLFYIRSDEEKIQKIVQLLIESLLWQPKKKIENKKDNKN